MLSIISEHGYRIDGRLPSQIRNINCRLGVYPQAEGSAYIEQGNTKVLCAVYGPHEAKRSRQLQDKCVINCQYSIATFAGLERKNRPRGDRKANEFTRLLEKTFESAVMTSTFPGSQIDIFCEVIQNDGSLLAACVNASTLALCDAGIPMKALVSASACGFIDGHTLVDLSNREETDLMPRITIATLGNTGQIVLIELENRLHSSHQKTVLEAAAKTCGDVFECLHAAVRSHLPQAAAIF